MKKTTLSVKWKSIALLISFVALVNITWAQQICAIKPGGGGTACSGSAFGETEYCQNMVYNVTYTIPSGYSSVAKFEWYVNNVLKKTSTTVTDNTFEWAVQDNATIVYCNVTYQTSSGVYSAPAKSNEFNVWQKLLNLAVDGPSTVTMGDPTAVGYSIVNGSSCLGCYSPPGSSYSVTWTPISNWTLASSANAGRNVTFTPDVNTGGTMTALVTMNACPYSKSFTKSVSRPLPTVFFSSGNPSTVCGSSANFSLDALPGATNYTFYIDGSTEATFTANGLQTITTNSNTVNISFSGSNSYVTLYGRANFGSSSTAYQVTSFQHGVPVGWADIQPVSPGDCYEQGPTYYFTIANPRNGVHYKWGTIAPGGGTTMSSWYTDNTTASFNFYAPGYYGIIVVPYNSCGDDTFYEYAIGVLDWPYTCSGMRAGGSTSKKGSAPGDKLAQLPGDKAPEQAIFPNPASSYIQVNNPVPMQSIKLYNAHGQLQKNIKVNATTKVTINVADLAAGVYFMVIDNGKTTERKRIVVQR